MDNVPMGSRFSIASIASRVSTQGFRIWQNL
jgi:hypothetical protein